MKLDKGVPIVVAEARRKGTAHEPATIAFLSSMNLLAGLEEHGGRRCGGAKD